MKPPPTDVEPKLHGRRLRVPDLLVPATSTSRTASAPPRTTTWHHGNDIFAPLGAPLLAVADGTLFRVGWNDVGGNRLWLRDGAGNEFYYAHLSAFSPLAQEGAQVQAGDVIGFVGNTGDADRRRRRTSISRSTLVSCSGWATTGRSTRTRT